MANDINKQVKSTTDLYYDFFSLLYLPVICSIDKSTEDDLQSSQSCPIDIDITNVIEKENTIKSNDKE